MAPPFQLNLDSTSEQILLDIVIADQERFKALAALIHTTDAEKELLLLKASVCQSIQAQLEGWAVADTHPSAPDWSRT